jgi:hypothetical protein
MKLMRILTTLGRTPVYLLLAAIAFGPSAFAQTTFDISGATEIYPMTINSTGMVAGYYATTPPAGFPGFGKDYFGFVRDAAGTITIFATPAPFPNGSLTLVWGMNSSGVVVGDSYWMSPYFKGFVRDSSGSISVINLAGSGNTSAKAINDNGQVTGNWLGQSPPYRSHGYILSGGTYTSFDVPNPSKSILTVHTNPISIDAAGNVAGRFTDSTNATHIFLRNARGHFTTYDIPGSTSIIVTKINDNGVIGGRYWNGSAQIGFTLTTSGKKVLTTFTVPGAVTFTSPNDLNFYGTVVGPYWDGSHNHGFLRDSNGVFVYFDVAGATDTIPIGLNNSGVSTGYYFDTLGAAHGFIR